MIMVLETCNMSYSFCETERVVTGHLTDDFQFAMQNSRNVHRLLNFLLHMSVRHPKSTRLEYHTYAVDWWGYIVLMIHFR